MAESYVVDMRHYADVDWLSVRDPAPLRRIVAYFGSVVEAGSASPHAGALWQSALRCPRRPDHKPCGGHFVVGRQDVPPRIDWECPKCGERGVVTGWRHSEWDLTHFRPAADGGVHCTLPASEHGAFFEEDLLEDDLCAVLRAGEWEGDDRVLVRGSEKNWDLLVGQAAALADQCASRTRQRRLLRAVERLHEAGRGRDRVGETRARTGDGDRSAGGTTQDLDREKLEEAALALLGLTLHGDRFGPRVWKGLDWDLMNALHERGWIHDPKGKARSVALTEEGARLAGEFLVRHFGRR